MSDEQDIDDIINQINFDELQEETLQEKKLQTSSSKLPSEKPDLADQDEFLDTILDMALEDRKLADDYYNVFLPEVSMGKDRSQASKEAMGKAIELKISAAKNIIDAKKIIDNKNNKTGNVGIFLGNSISSKKAGIDLSKFQNELDD